MGERWDRRGRDAIATTAAHSGAEPAVSAERGVGVLRASWTRASEVSVERQVPRKAASGFEEGGAADERIRPPVPVLDDAHSVLKRRVRAPNREQFSQHKYSTELTLGLNCQSVCDIELRLAITRQVSAMTVKFHTSLVHLVHVNTSLM